MPFPSPSFNPQSRGGGLGRRRRRFRRPWASGRGGEEGERGSGVRGIDSPAHLGSGRGEGAGRRGPAAAAPMERGGGAVARRGELEAAEAVVRRLRSSGSLYSWVKVVQRRWPVRGAGGRCGVP